MNANQNLFNRYRENLEMSQTGLVDIFDRQEGDVLSGVSRPFCDKKPRALVVLPTLIGTGASDLSPYLKNLLGFGGPYSEINFAEYPMDGFDKDAYLGCGHK